MYPFDLRTPHCRFMEPLTSAVPFMVIEGNHEIELQGNNVEFASYQARFSVPFRESGSPNAFYYSFNAGGIHFLMLGAYIDYNKTSKYLLCLSSKPYYAWVLTSVEVCLLSLIRSTWSEKRDP